MCVCVCLPTCLHTCGNAFICPARKKNTANANKFDQILPLRKYIWHHVEFSIYFHNFWKFISEKRLKEEKKDLKFPKQLHRKLNSIKILIFKIWQFQSIWMGVLYTPFYRINFSWVCSKGYNVSACLNIRLLKWK